MAEKTKYEQRRADRAQKTRATAATLDTVGTIANGIGVYNALAGNFGIAAGAFGASVVTKGAAGMANRQATRESLKGKGVGDLVRRSRGEDLGSQVRTKLRGERRVDATGFDQANQHFAASHMTNPSSGGGVHDGGRGWANPVVQKAAQAARKRRSEA